MQIFVLDPSLNNQDTDNDGINDFAEDGTPLDLCPRDNTAWTSSPQTDSNADGCQDLLEDPDYDYDNDNDGINDFTEDGTPLDLCPRDNTAWTSSPQTDSNADGCQDLLEDPDYDYDNDNDGINDFAEDGTPLDLCPRDNTAWTSSPQTDSSADGCQDSLEDPDYDYDNDNQDDKEDVDDDNDGLIEIGDGVLEGVSGLLMLHNMRNDLDGTHYNDGKTSSNVGCPTRGCNGYELITDLDFDTDRDGSTFVGNSVKACNVILDNGSPRTDFSGCTIDSGDTVDEHSIYFPAPGGWLPIGDSDNNFAATFEGNGHTINNLYIYNRGKKRRIGLFNSTSKTATIRNIGLVGGLIRYSAVSNGVSSGNLVGWNKGNIISSYTTVDNYSSGFGGGIVGWNFGDISSSYATGDISSFTILTSIGGLVGRHDGSISFSYVTGNVSSSERGGGLVGTNHGSITSSYALGKVFASDLGGGLIAGHFSSSISSSYWNTSATSHGIGRQTYGTGTPRGFSEIRLKATSGTYPSGLKGSSWDLGTDSQYPGIVIGRCIHRPTGSAVGESVGFTVVPVCTGL